MNLEKLKQLQAQQAQVRIGGKGTVRRKKKVVHRTATTDDKKLQSSLKKLQVNNIPGIEEVNMIKDDGTVIHFNNPKVQASLAANTFAVTGHAENKQITEMLPGILNQLGPESLTHLKRLASNVTGGGTGAMEQGLEDEDDDDDEVPDLVENFDEVSKNEAATVEVVPEAEAEVSKTEAATAEVVAEASPEAEAAPEVEVSKTEAATVEVVAEASPEAEAAPEVEAEVSKNEAATAEVVPEAAPEVEAAPAKIVPEAAPEAEVEAATVAEVKDVEEAQPDGDGAKEE